MKGDWYSGFALKSWLAMSLSTMTGYVRSKSYGLHSAKQLPESMQESDFVRAFFGIAYVSQMLTLLTSDANKSPEFLKAIPESHRMVEHFLSHLRNFESHMWKLIQSPLDRVPSREFQALVCSMIHERIELGFMSFYCGNVCRDTERRILKSLRDVQAKHRIAVDVRDAVWNVRPQSSLQVHDMSRLVERLRTEPTFEKAKSIFLSDLPISEILTVLKGDAFFSELDEYIRKYYFMCERDEDVLETRWIDDPSPLLMLIQLHLQSESLSRDTSEKMPDLIRWVNGEKDVASWKGVKMDQLRADVITLRKFLFWKDEVHESYLRCNFFLCKILQEFGRRLELRDANEIFHADYRSILRFIDGEIDSDALYKVIEEHRTIRQMYKNFTPPSYVKDSRPIYDQNEPAATEYEGTYCGCSSYRGVPGSGGIYTGTIRVCPTLKDAVTLQKGEILVTESTSPSWTPLFNLIGAVIVEHGGRLSHACVVARELGIPCVMNLDICVTSGFVTGMKCTVDGDAGVVYIHPEKKDEEKGGEEEIGKGEGEEGEEGEEDLDAMFGEAFESLKDSRDSLRSSRP